MASFNQVTLLGNVTRDPQIKHLPSQTTVAEFGLAMNRRFKTAAGEDREEVCFIDCTAFGKAADIIGEHVTKGKPLLVSGRLKLDQWDDKQGGGKRSKITVVVESFQFVGSKSDGGGGENGSNSQPARQQQRQQPAQQPADNNPGEFKEDDIPF